MTMNAANKEPTSPETAGDWLAGKAEIETRVPEFSELTSPGTTAPMGSLTHLLDVTCTVTAELGRTNLAISDVLKLNVGSVVELNRLVSEPVDVIVQGVRLARGEVVVVNDHFAIRIKEIVDPRKR
jgi:flagellar motor switch protein FliN/FliY